MLIHNKIAVVVPVYSAEKILDELCSRLTFNLSQITDSFEIILVDDSSSDSSWIKIKENTLKDDRIKGYLLSRNFGQHHAITAGIDKANAEWVVVMDCDLQDRPEEIVELYKALEGFDIVLAELGYTSIISSIWLLAGVILSSTGKLVIYIGKIYDGIKIDLCILFQKKKQ